MRGLFVVVLLQVLVRTVGTLLPWSEKDAASLQWEAIPQPMSTRRSHFAAAAANETFFVFGGYFEEGNSLPNSEMYRMDGWETIPPMPTARDGCAAVTVGNNQIMIFGGWDGTNVLTTVEMWDGKEYKTLPPLSTPRFGPAVVTVGQNNNNQRVLVLGGKDEPGDLPTAEMFHIETQTWTPLPPMPSVEGYPCVAAAVGEKVFVFGHHAEGPVIDVYDTDTQTWGPSLPMPFVRKHGAAVSIGTKIVLIGGYNGREDLRTVNMFDTFTQTWTTLPSMTTKRRYCGAALVGNQIVVAGGEMSNGTFLDTSERLDMSVMMVPTPPKIPPPPNRLLGFNQQQVALHKWAKQVLAHKKDYVKAVNATKQRVSESFRVKMKALTKEMQRLKLEEASLAHDKAQIFKVLEDGTNQWIGMINRQLQDAKDQLEALRARMLSDEHNQDHHLLCPLTGKLMTDPVVAADGHTYERSAVEEYLAGVPEGQDATSPVTGQVLPYRMLAPNLSIQSLLRTYKQEKGKSSQKNEL